MAKNYIIAEGFIVNGKGAGEVLKLDEIENVQSLLGSGRIFLESPKKSITMDSTQPIDNSGRSE